jgi:hypothetical protein
MNLGPKVGPLVAELLSGIIALLIIYVAIHGLTFAGIDELSSGALVVLGFLAWILGTFFDLIRNLLEWLWDRKAPLNWSFFFRGDQKKLENLEHYFWSFYILDADIAVAILLSVFLSPFLEILSAGTIRSYMWPIWFLLLGITFLFACDARLLRHEIKGLLDAEPK